MRAFVQRSARVACGTVALVVALGSSAHSECTNPVLLDTPIPSLIGPNTDYIATGDFNEDGILDLAVGNVDRGPGSLNSSVAVLIGTGNRAYAAPVHYAVGGGAVGVVARDFNGDGILDLAVAKLFANNVSVLLGQGTGGVGNGTFAAAVDYATGPNPFELVSADFNGDGILDLATALNGSSAVSVLPGLGSGGVGNGTFGPFTTFPIANASTGLAVGDFNHDGVPDLVATENYSGTVGVLLGTGAAILGPGSFASVAHYGAGIQPFHIEVADFNEDGNPDLAVANTASGGIRVLVGLANGTFVYQTSLASGNNSGAAVGDLNHDGILDIVTGTNLGSNTGTAEVFLGQGTGGVGNGTFGGVTVYASGGDVYAVIVGDFDQDGAQDVLTTEGNGSYIALLPGTCAEAPPDLRAPTLTDVRDVPNDNGGKVFLTWTASSLDVTGGAVNNYRVWRRIPPALSSMVTPSRLSSGEVVALMQDNVIVYWEALATLPAQRLAGYGYTAATTQDSMPDSNPYTAFFVSALTANIDVFYSSAIDSGYSVDNITPAPPAQFTGAPVASGFSLQWEPCADADLDGYRVYRGPSADFTPSQATLVAQPKDPGWVDASGHGEWYYKLSAVDVHTNESGFALLAPLGTVGADRPRPVFALQGARPNPSVDGRLSILFSLEEGPGARLEVLDVSGRRVVSRDLGTWGAGSHVLTLGDEKPLPSGVYFVRLIQNQRLRQSRAVVTR